MYMKESGQSARDFSKSPSTTKPRELKGPQTKNHNLTSKLS